MLSLDRLPNEVLHSIASFLYKKYDLAALSRVNRHCYQIASPILWKREAKSDRPGALHWAAENGDLNVLIRALDAGVKPSKLAYAHKPKCRIENKHKWWNYHSTYYDDPSWRADDDDDDDMSVDLDLSYVLHDHCNCFEGGCDEGIFNDCSWEPIHIAASKGRIDLIEELLDRGANIDGFSWGFCLCRPHLPLEAFQESRAVDEEELEDLHGGGWTPLHIAICHGQIETAKFLLRRGASTTIYQGIDFELVAAAWQDADRPRDSSRFKLTALHHAAKHDSTELCQFIMDEKYQEDVNCEGPFMGTPLLQAIWHGHWDTVVPWLLKNGADIDARLIETRLTPLMMASFSRRFDDASRLVDLGANVTTLSVHQFSILHLILGPSHMDYEFEDPPSESPVPRPKSEVTEAEIIQKFLAKGFPVDAREALLGMTPLMVASASCNVDAIKALLDGGADVNALDHDGLSALTRVGESADGPNIAMLCDAARMLLDAGATFTGVIDDLTPLNIICSRQSEIYATRFWEEQHVKLVKLFIERGADPNEKGVSPSRPFTEAVIHGNYTLAQAILESGGRPEPNDMKSLLEKSSKEMYDDGRTEYIAGLDFAKFELDRPSEPFFVRLIFTALQNQLWTRAADLLKAAPIPKEMRRGLMHRCLRESEINADDPSFLVRALLDLGEDVNELCQGEPPIYFSLKSAYCWRSTPILVNAGADVHMATPTMPDGAFMYSVRQGYQTQTLQILAKHPGILKDRPERLHRECWESLIRWGTHSRPGSSRRGEPCQVPYLYWNIAKRLIDAGLRTDVKFEDGSDVKSVVEKAVPTSYALGSLERGVLDTFGIPYQEPDENAEGSEVQQLINAGLLDMDEFGDFGPGHPEWDDEAADTDPEIYGMPADVEYDEDDEEEEEWEDPDEDDEEEDEDDEDIGGIPVEFVMGVMF
ncbi:Fc.00g050160.m01.CDS01 [Cosmosporella sp. VM-42]